MDRKKVDANEAEGTDQGESKLPEGCSSQMDGSSEGGSAEIRTPQRPYGSLATRMVFACLNDDDLMQLWDHAEPRGWSVGTATTETDLIAIPSFATVIDRRVFGQQMWADFEAFKLASSFVRASPLIIVDDEEPPHEQFTRARMDTPEHRQRLFDLLDRLHNTFLNNALNDVYIEKLPLVKKLLRSDPKLSAPYLINVPIEYEQAGRKMMVVGPHPRGWKWGYEIDYDVRWLMNASHRFKYGRAGRQAPFWMAAHELYRRLCPVGPEDGFLWNCIDKMARAGRRPPTSIEERVSGLGLLETELFLIQPEIVVFMTGPAYDNRLRAYNQKNQPMCEMQFKPLSRVTARLEHPSLPVLTFRTSNPNRMDSGVIQGELQIISDMINTVT